MLSIYLTNPENVFGDKSQHNRKFIINVWKYQLCMKDRKSSGKEKGFISTEIIYGLKILLYDY